MPRLHVGALLLVLSCASSSEDIKRQATDSVKQRQATERDEAVIATIVREVILKDPRVARRRAVMVEDHTIGNVLLRDYPPRLSHETAGLYAAVLAKNEERVRITCKECPSPSVLVDAFQLSQHSSDEQRQAYLRQIRPEAHGTYSFHLPGYDGNLALVQYVWVAGSLAMEGVWVLVKHTENGWEVLEARQTWAA